VAGGPVRAYKILSILGDIRAARRGPGALVRRQVRKEGHKRFGRLLRKIFRP
jgi:hypothetical protein